MKHTASLTPAPAARSRKYSSIHFPWDSDGVSGRAAAMEGSCAEAARVRGYRRTEGPRSSDELTRKSFIAFSVFRSVTTAACSSSLPTSALRIPKLLRRLEERRRRDACAHCTAIAAGRRLDLLEVLVEYHHHSRRGPAIVQLNETTLQTGPGPAWPAHTAQQALGCLQVDDLKRVKQRLLFEGVDPLRVRSGTRGPSRRPVAVDSAVGSRTAQSMNILRGDFADLSLSSSLK